MDSSTHIEAELARDFSLQVKRLQFADYLSIVREQVDAVEIAPSMWDTWGEVPAATPIVNENAGPCIIIYVYDPLSGAIMYGHFTEAWDAVSLRRAQDNLKKADTKGIIKSIGSSPGDEVLLPSKESARSLKAPQYHEYRSMLEHIGFKTQKGSQLEVYLFGQHFRLRRDPALGLVDRLDVTTSLRNAGIPIDRIMDTRPLEVNKEMKSDSTVYVPGDRTIYFDRSQ